MASPYNLSILPILKGDRIEDWRLTLEAGTQQLAQGEEGQQRALPLLPAYTNRDVADREEVRDLLKLAPTIKEALDKLGKLRDPPVD